MLLLYLKLHSPWTCTASHSRHIEITLPIQINCTKSEISVQGVTHLFGWVKILITGIFATSVCLYQTNSDVRVRPNQSHNYKITTLSWLFSVSFATIHCCSSILSSPSYLLIEPISFFPLILPIDNPLDILTKSISVKDNSIAQVKVRLPLSGNLAIDTGDSTLRIRLPFALTGVVVNELILLLFVSGTIVGGWFWLLATRCFSAKMIEIGLNQSPEFRQGNFRDLYNLFGNSTPHNALK